MHTHRCTLKVTYHGYSTNGNARRQHTCRRTASPVAVSSRFRDTERVAAELLGVVVLSQSGIRPPRDDRPPRVSSARGRECVRLAASIEWRLTVSGRSWLRTFGETERLRLRLRRELLLRLRPFLDLMDASFASRALSTEPQRCPTVEIMDCNSGCFLCKAAKHAVTVACNAMLTAALHQPIAAVVE
eukprot:COSAG02_NODE_28411_length_590_cov_0.782077_1_plen_187_part_00